MPGPPSGEAGLSVVSKLFYGFQNLAAGRVVSVFFRFYTTVDDIDSRFVA
jgi:hypothetical protein